MLAKHFSSIRNYVLSVSSQRKYEFYHQNTLLDDFRTNSRNIIGRNPSMVIPLLANQDLTPMLGRSRHELRKEFPNCKTPGLKFKLMCECCHDFQIGLHLLMLGTSQEEE